MAVLALFFSIPIAFGIISGQDGFFWVTPVFCACYMALITCMAKKLWHKLLFNSLFLVGAVVSSVVDWSYIIPKYMPELSEFAKAHPDSLVKTILNFVIIYSLSAPLFIFVYHVALKTKSEKVLSSAS